MGAVVEIYVLLHLLPESTFISDKTRKAKLTQWGMRNSDACLKAQSPEGARRPAANYL